MKRSKISFKTLYLIYLSLLVLTIIALTTYVNILLHQYEDMRPQRCVQEAMNQLATDASAGDFWNKYSLPEVKPGNYEIHLDVQSKYLSLYMDEDVRFVQKSGTHEEDELYYQIKNEDIVLAEIKLKATGPAVTKLAVLSFREWQIEYIAPILETSEYTITVPKDFEVRVNGIGLDASDGIVSNENEITYIIRDIYLEPTFDIRDKEGDEVAYSVADGQVIAEFYNYTLTLPIALKVELNGDLYQGEAVGDNRVRYDIRTLEKPRVNISDYFGNTINYEGGDEVPLTHMTITADSRHIIMVEGKVVPREAVTTYDNKEFELLSDYVSNLPQISVYDIAILKDNAEILVTDEKENTISLAPENTLYDFTSHRNALEEVPAEVSAEINVLEIAQQWSLFVSNDIPFAQIEKYLIEGSYQHQVAVQYASGVDITFTSKHTLMNPAFTDNAVTNFVWITDNCFSVDINFIKHMVLRSGAKVDDPMNDRFYFVKYDDTEDGVTNPIWKMIGLKEIVNNER